MDIITASGVALPPQAIEAEQSIIGGILIKPDSFDRIDHLSANDFFRADHRLIYAAMRSMIEAGKPLDALLLCEYLRDRDELELVGGMSYIGELATSTLSAAN